MKWFNREKGAALFHAGAHTIRELLVVALEFRCVVDRERHTAGRSPVEIRPGAKSLRLPLPIRSTRLRDELRSALFIVDVTLPNERIVRLHIQEHRLGLAVIEEEY